MTLRTCLFGLLVFACAIPAHGQIVNLLPADINLGDTETASFSDDFVTLTPLLGGVPDTFSANMVRLGMDSPGTNVGSFNDPDTEVDSANDESLEFAFTGGAGLEAISYDFSRADGDGPRDGVVISGFLADPNVTFSVDDENLFAVYDSVAGSVRLNIPGTLFSSAEVFIGFDAAASADQTLLMTVNDTTQANGQFAIRSISYNEAPVSESLLGDVNLDMAVNFLDISPFIAVLSSGDFQDEADIDRNEAVNFLDISPFIGLLSGS